MSETASQILALGFFILLVVASIWILWRTHRSGSVASILKWILLLVGSLTGIGLSFVSYQLGPDYQYDGLPVPMAVMHREHDAWVDFVAPHAMFPVILLLNALFVSAAIHACALATCWILKRRKHGRGGATSHAGP